MTYFHPARATVLQLDLDSPAAYRHFTRSLPWLSWACRPVAMAVTPSRTPSHRHVTIVLARPLSPAMRVAIQVILGSDRVRERWNLTRLLRGSRYPIVFFERQPHV